MSVGPMSEALAERLDAFLERLLRIALLFPAWLAAALLAGAFASPADAREDIPRDVTLASCGTDLRSTLSIEQRQAIAEDASGTIAGEGLFWRVEKDGVEPSYLLGTMHLPDPRVTTLPSSVTDMLDAADRTVLELAEIADPQMVAGVLFSRPDILMLSGDRSLKTILNDDQYAKVSAGLAGKGIPIEAMTKMQPWFISVSLATPDCAALDMEDPSGSVDGTVAMRAKEAGQEVLGLETVEEQLSALASLPLETQIEQLVSTMDSIDDMNDMMETMIGLYRDEEIAAIIPTLKALYPNAEAVVGGSATFAAFEEVLIDRRNRLMVERAEPILEQGNSFVGVGALHLIGETGLVNGLRREGWTVTRVDLGS